MQNKMNKILCLILIFSGNLIAQVSGNEKYKGNSNYNDNANYNYNNQNLNIVNQVTQPLSNAVIENKTEVSFEINGLYNIVADNYVAMFNIMQIAETVETADLLTNERISVFKQKLKNIGIDTSEIKVDMLSFVPKYELQADKKLFSKTFNEVPAGFEMQKNITVRYKKSAKIDEIVSAAAQAEIYDLVKVDYFISNTQEILDSLRIKAISCLKNKTKSYELLGFKLDTLKKVFADNFVTTSPTTRYRSYQAFSRPSLNAAKKKSYVNEINKTYSQYYKQIEYDLYDFIVNPIVTEPVIQISYTLLVKYFLKPEEKPNNTYYILSPSGEMKQFIPK